MMDHVVVANTDLAYSFVLSASQLGSPRSTPRQRLLVVPGLLVGGLDLDGEGPRVDGEHGLGVWRRLVSLHSLGPHVSLLVNLGGFVHDFKLLLASISLDRVYN